MRHTKQANSGSRVIDVCHNGLGRGGIALFRLILPFLGWGAYCSALLLPNILLLNIDRDTVSIEKLLIAVILLLGWHLAFRKLQYAVISMLPFFLILPFDLFFTWTYQEPPSLAVAGILAHTNINEALDYLQGRKLEIALGFAIALSVWTCAFYFARQVGSTKRLILLRWVGRALTASWVIALATSLTLATAAPLASHSKNVIDRSGNLAFGLDKLTGVFPFGRVFSVVSYVVDEQKSVALNYQLRNFTFGAKQYEGANQRQVYVLIIGEASRADRWQLQSYVRGTNPLLSHTSGVVALTNVVTPWTWTDASIPVIVSRKPGTEQSQLFPERSIVSLFKEAGFHTTWLSNQPSQSNFSPIGLPASEADEVHYLNVAANNVFGKTTYDEVLLPALQSVLARPIKRQFLVIHLLGSHDSYEKRYPSSFNRWHPSESDLASTAGPGSARDRLNNSYDNTILYTDYVIANVIDLLKRTDALSGVYYVSDHGESLLDGKCTQTGHGNTSYYNYPVSALVWLSDRYVAVYPEIARYLRLHSNSKLTTENTFESLAGLAHIAYRNADVSRDIFSAKFREKQRLVNVGGNVVDWDHAQFISECRKPVASKSSGPQLVVRTQN